MRVALLLLLSIFIHSCSLGYLIEQGYGHLKLMSLKEPIRDVLKDPEVDERTKRKIELVQEVREFCENDLGMKKTRAFTTFVRLEGKFVAYVVSACPKVSLRPYEWKFPLIGRMPYKGFFSKEDALREKELLEGMGYDTLLQGVQAYSTLGWFEDPILSTMMELDDVSLVNVVIHELTHRNVFKKGYMDFNERVATFTGYRGTILFFERREGKGSKSASFAREIFEDEKTFSRFIQRSLKRLEFLYAMDISTEEKLKRREMVFFEILEDFKKIKKFLRTGAYDFFEREGINNAVLLNLRRYIGHMDDLEGIYSLLEGNLRRFLALLRKIVSEEKDPDRFLSNWPHDSRAVMDSWIAVNMNPIVKK